jgi:cytochrome c oxidase subunit 4
MSSEDHSKNYINVLLALAVLTVVTVAVTHIPNIPRWGAIGVGLTVATIKASLVVMFFMHLKYEHRWWAGIVLFPLALVFIIIGSNLTDTGLNGHSNGGDLLSDPDPIIKHVGQPGHAGNTPAPAKH